MVILFMSPSSHFKSAFSDKKKTMAKDKGMRSLKASGIEIYTMSYITE
jgi:hypothetical protein